MGKIYFPQFRRGRKGIEIQKGMTILEAAQVSGAGIHAECGGVGKCGKCAVRVERGEENLSLPSPEEKELLPRRGERLACKARIERDLSDITVFIRHFGEYEILGKGAGRQVELLPLFHRDKDMVFREDVPVDDYRGAIYGIAADLGTTTLVLELVNLEDGQILDTSARTNPQISYGNDVVSRIEFTSSDRKNGRYFGQEEKMERLSRLRGLLAEIVNDSIKLFSGKMGRDIGECIYHLVGAGNPVMRNIFFGIDVSSLGVMPYEPLHKEAVISKPSSLGLDMNDKGEVYGVPLIGGHVGGDTVAGILACGMYRKKEIGLLVDIGTNGEIVLGNNSLMIASSCAAGGAFEGTSVSCGTGSIEGAIKSISISDGRISFSTIGGKDSVGVCGSGLIDLLAEMLRNGLMTENARITEDFRISGDLRLTQSDIYQLITSKAAIKTGWQILLRKYPAQAGDINRVCLSGGFGNFINTKNAARIGLIPCVDEKKIEKIGNGSLEGAREILINRRSLKDAAAIAAGVIHVKPNEAEKDFEYMLAGNMYFKGGE